MDVSKEKHTFMKKREKFSVPAGTVIMAKEDDMTEDVDNEDLHIIENNTKEVEIYNIEFLVIHPKFGYKWYSIKDVTPIYDKRRIFLFKSESKINVRKSNKIHKKYSK